MDVLLDKDDFSYKALYIQGTFENKHTFLYLLSLVVFLAEIKGE